MRQQTRSRIADGLDRTRLLAPVERLREGWLALRAPRPKLDAKGLPLPPPRFRLLVDGRSADPDLFLALGAQLCDSIQRAAAESGRPVGEMRAILDFGCGCGRVARHWAGVEGPEVYGCDYNPDLVGWSQANLPHLRATGNELDPPAPFDSGGFDLIYALSVFSHLDERRQRAWLAEFERLLRPDGLLVMSVLGERLRHRLDRREQDRFDAGEMVVQRPRRAGSNLCTVYHPPSFVTGDLLSGFAEVRRFELGAPELPIHQDGYVARRR
jgi:SAM-dependent methyltransferase